MKGLGFDRSGTEAFALCFARWNVLVFVAWATVTGVACWWAATIWECSSVFMEKMCLLEAGSESSAHLCALAGVTPMAVQSARDELAERVISLENTVNDHETATMEIDRKREMTGACASCRLGQAKSDGSQEDPEQVLHIKDILGKGGWFVWTGLWFDGTP